MISQPLNPRLHYDAELGVVVDTDVTLSADQLARVAAWALPKWLDRWRSLPPGDRKDQTLAAISALKAGRIRQNLINRQTRTGKGELRIL